MKMVVLDGYTLNPGDQSWDALKSMGELVVYDRSAEAEVVARAKDATVLFTNKTPVTGKMMEQLPALQYIGVLATGYNIVDVNVAKSRGIVVANVPGYGSSSVVQLCFALLLELTHHVQLHSDSVRSGEWTNSADFSYWKTPLIELKGKTMGIIGFGNIGQQVADVAAAFGMNVIACSRTQSDQRHRPGFRWVDPGELFAEADFISIHCPLTDDTKGMINTTSISKMKRSAFIINTSRGPIIVEKDLADALNNEVIAGAALDVLSSEPPPANNPLLTAKNCLITPHIAWATREARVRLLETTVKNLRSYLDGKPSNVVNN
jgi:glycerate dehydrogenase